MRASDAASRTDDKEETFTDYKEASFPPRKTDAAQEEANLNSWTNSSDKEKEENIKDFANAGAIDESLYASTEEEVVRSDRAGTLTEKAEKFGRNASTLTRKQIIGRANLVRL